MAGYYCTISEPPATRCLSNVTTESYVKSRMLPSLLFPKFPCHTQTVERAVKLVTEASASVVDSFETDGYIIAKLQSRKKMPKYKFKPENYVEELVLKLDHFFSFTKGFVNKFR